MTTRSSEIERLRKSLQSEFPNIRHRRRSASVDLEDSESTIRSNLVVNLKRSDQRPELFGYQRELGGEILKSIRQSERALLALPTGGGKTRTAVAAVLDGLTDESCRQVVWLAPSIELIDQAVGTFQAMWRSHGSAPDIRLVRRTSDVAGPEPVVFLTTPQSVYSQARRRRAASTVWDAIIFDEAHQLGAATFRAATESLMASGSAIALIGLSATPGRVDPEETEDLVALFGGNLLTSRQLRPNPIEVLQRRGVLSRLEFKSIGDEQSSQWPEEKRLAASAHLAARLGGKNGHVLVFTSSVAGAIVLAEAVQSIGIQADAVHAGMSDSARDTAIDRFGRGDVRVLVNQRLLATGYDCPAISDLILAGRIGSPILFEQVVGRAARGPRTGGLRSSHVWQFDDHLALHGLPQSYYRFRDFDWS